MDAGSRRVGGPVERVRRAFAVLTLLGLAACQTTPDSGSAPAVDADTLAFAQAACGGCHAVEPNALSPNRDAPEFPAIVNRPGLNSETLTRWLVDAHNYPEEMDFDLDQPQVEELVDYMLSLQNPEYRPPIQ